ncbi:hypothetical protein [Conexibacter woesei]|uniref:SpaA-like prealbumin fold domain-containing protein n=1 Tax=Conexibacter woesei (strain DSM 14684 / CCUG 47730 / CIP 108061 / JCM 11494 / NBRC 100937 / ID131577) TaxID=469383 RepID=D3EZ62_CONWI|nr:hypothetical protein [Conexibacter woesei]ADB51827.1 hypothetical protein Cwoe_3409 [Conexibacter woesei DSM 14684]
MRVPTRRLVVLTAVALLAAAAGSGAADAAVCATARGPVNGSFEEPAVGGFYQFPEEKVPGWHTTASDHRIELWQSGYNGVPSADGDQFAELAGTEPSELFQDVATTPGETFVYRIFHRGRRGDDTMRIEIGPPGGPPDASRTVTTSNTEWQQVVGVYRVPPELTTTRLGFEAVSSASSDPSQGNFIDGVAFGGGDCAVMLANRLLPAGDDGRFDLLLGGVPVATAVGDGATAGPFSNPFAAITVAERAAPGTRLESYASVVRCLDDATGEPVVQEVGTETTLRFDRQRDVTCRFANVRAPAVVLRTAIEPGGDPGRFDLRVNGRLVASAAGDGTVAPPERVGSGPVTVSEHAATGTTQAGYATAIACRSRAGRGPVIAADVATRLRFEPAGADVVVCTLLNVARRPPPPPQPPHGPSGTPGVPGAPGVPAAPIAENAATAMSDAVDLVVRAAPVRQRVRVPGPARVRVHVANRGPSSATDVRIAVSARRAGLPVRGVALLPRTDCVSVRGGGACRLARLPAGGHATVELSLAAARGGRLVVRAGARADEQERTPADNVARAIATVVGARQPSGPAPPVTG